tara:strand:+ start:476 stop:1756 length:1281 start_codon:yes stop_codon:yes gene_type:complete
LILQKVFHNRLIKIFSLKRNPKPFFILNLLFLFFIFDVSKAETNSLTNSENNKIELKYLESRNELEDYIIDTGDSISLEFFPADELSGFFPVNKEGEILLPRLDETYVRGLTTSELKSLLEKRYADFLIDPEITVRIAVFKSIRVLVRGELRNSGYFQFPPYKSVSLRNYTSNSDSLLDLNNQQLEIGEYSKSYNLSPDIVENLKSNNLSTDNIIVKRSNENITTISDVIRKAGGITSSTDLSRIEIIRDVSLGKGGGKKKAFIDFNSFLNEADPTNDIRIFDGDSLFFPKLSKNDPNQIPKSVLSGISPKFISVNLFGRVENPGVVKLPLESVLSDAIDLSGPVRPLSGKIVLIRYLQDGTIIKKNIAYSARAKRGSKRNPYLVADDLISVKDSFLGKTSSFLKELTAPFVGIYSTKEVIEGFTD